MESKTKRTTGAGAMLDALILALLAHTSPLFAGELSVVDPPRPAELRLPDLQGEVRDLRELRGRVLLVNFWASWCRPCIEEMPSIQRLSERMADRPFAVIGVDVQEGVRRVKTAASRLGIWFPILLDTDGTAFKRWDARIMPTNYLIDKQGRIRVQARGPFEWDDRALVEQIEVLLAEPNAEDGVLSRILPLDRGAGTDWRP